MTRRRAHTTGHDNSHRPTTAPGGPAFLALLPLAQPDSRGTPATAPPAILQSCEEGVPNASSNPPATVTTPLTFPRSFPTAQSERENLAIFTPAPGDHRDPFACVAAARRAGPAAAAFPASIAFPFYAYDPDGTHRRENVTDAALDHFRAHYRDPVISKWSIFDYVYAALHHPAFRATFANELCLHPPRVPLAPDFRAFQRVGQKLFELHLHATARDDVQTRTAKLLTELPEQFRS